MPHIGYVIAGPELAAGELVSSHRKKPRGHVERVIVVTDTAVTTAGDYRDYVEVDGQRYPHILDPVTGR